MGVGVFGILSFSDSRDARRRQVEQETVTPETLHRIRRLEDRRKEV